MGHGTSCQYGWVDQMVSANCEFETERLRAAPWHEAARHSKFDLPEVVGAILTAQTTAALPDAWRGNFSAERAREWIDERDQESPTLLLTDTESDRPVGLIILFEVPLSDSMIDVRIGFLIAEDDWGRGLATELVAGLADWARTQKPIRTLTGGIDATNPASARVLIKNGFEQIDVGERGETTFQLRVKR